MSDPKEISRRDFLRRGAAFGGGVLVSGFLARLAAAGVPLEGPSRVLVVIEFTGGNDGLNTIIPHRNDIYYRSRPKLAIPRREVIDLDGNLGFHPALASLRPLWDQGELAILNNIGYPNQNRSHFKSRKHFYRGNPQAKADYSGWIGRYLDHHPEEGSWQALDVDGNILSPAMVGNNRSGLPLSARKTLGRFVGNPWFYHLEKHPPIQKTTTEDFLFHTMSEAFRTADFFKTHHTDFNRSGNYPDNNRLAASLKQIADLMVGGSPTRVYYARLGSFDTHSGQKNWHRKLLTAYADALHAFSEDLRKNGLWENTLVLTYSEFGRRVAENQSQGTDHGKANNLFLAGGKLNKAGIYNPLADLSRLDDGDVPFDLDFRSVYATVLEKWLNADPGRILEGRFPILDLL